MNFLPFKRFVVKVRPFPFSRIGYQYEIEDKVLGLSLTMAKDIYKKIRVLEKKPISYVDGYCSNRLNVLMNHQNKISKVLYWG